MCGRFTLTDPDPRMLRQRFELPEQPQVAAQGRFNIAPTDAVLAVNLGKTGERRLGRLRWGLIPHYADPESFDRMLINARAESVADAPAFRDAFAGFRCLVVADGFYEWKATEAGKRPVWITRPDREPFAFAGLWARAKPGEGEPVYSCAIVTCPAGELVRPVHDRMPVILDPDDESAWLDPTTDREELEGMLAPTDELELKPVSQRVNDVRNDGPELLEAPEEPLQLF